MWRMIPAASLGLGWRPETAWTLERRADLGFTEVLAESLDARRPPPLAIRNLVARGCPAVVHGVSLSLGSVEAPCERRLSRLARLSEALGSPLVSEHAAFVRAGGHEAGHLLPLPRTRVQLEILIDNVRRAQAGLPVPLALENVAALVEWPEAEMDEADFLSAVVRETGCLLLLDLSNLLANASNHGHDSSRLLSKLPLDKVAYVHLAGGTERDGLLVDTHAHPVRDDSLGLLDELVLACRQRGVAIPPVLLERDDAFPGRSELDAELDAIHSRLRAVPHVA